MRVTNNMTVKTVISNIQKNTERLDSTNRKLSTGKRINIPQDDPSGTIKAMAFRSALEEIDQYIRNVDSGQSLLQTTDIALGQITDVLQRFRELSVKAANGTFEQNSLDAIGDEMSQLLDEAVGIANTKLGSKYIFGGFQTVSPPFVSYTGNTDEGVDGSGPDLIDINGNVREGINSDYVTIVKYNGDSGKIVIEIDENVRTTTNINGQEAFLDIDNVFEAMINTRNSIYRGEVKDITGDGISIQDGIESLQNSIDKIIRYRSEVGAKMHRLGSQDRKLNDQKLNITDLMSKIEDTDVTEAIMDLKVQESVQRMSLSVGARVIQPTLLDFLR